MIGVQQSSTVEEEMAGRKERVTEIIDGDTFKTGSRKNPIRLSNVDAPEKGEAGGAAATERLRRLIEDKEVRIDTQARDSYGRSVANVYLGNKSVNKEIRRRLK